VCAWICLTFGSFEHFLLFQEWELDLRLFPDEEILKAEYGAKRDKMAPEFS